jgi:transposase InsO family protein
VPRQRFHHVHIDIVGPLPVSTKGYTYVLTMIDRATRWLEATPMKTMDTAACVDAMIQCWVSRYGVPAILTSYRGTQFVSAVWQSLCRCLGIQQAVTTAYHPQANGMVERAHRQLKDVLKARLAGPQWPEHLPWALLGLRAAPKEDSAVSWRS